MFQLLANFEHFCGNQTRKEKFFFNVFYARNQQNNNIRTIVIIVTVCSRIRKFYSPYLNNI